MRNIILAGRTLDKSMGLIRLGRISMTPSEIQSLELGGCATRYDELRAVAESVPIDAAQLLTPRDAEPVHVFVASANEVHVCQGIQHHVLSTPLPPGSFMRICEGVLVPSWPLYFVLKCAEIQSFSERLKLGMELCGSYTHVIPGDETTGVFYREANKTGELIAAYNNSHIAPALSCDELKAYLKEAHRTRGLLPARAAAKCLLDGSASPSESVLALMMSLGVRQGGYGFQEIELNPKIPVPADLRYLTFAEAYHPDCYLVLLKTDLEFQSYENHEGRRALIHDASRRNDIQALGIEVKDVTWDTVSHLDKLDRLALQLVHKEKELGMRGAAGHERALRHPDNVARRRVRLDELLPRFPYEQ